MARNPAHSDSASHHSSQFDEFDLPAHAMVPDNQPQFTEDDWLSGPGVDVTKLDAAAEAAKPGRTTQTPAFKSERPFDKTSPYFHPCPKCRGSGSFYSFTGRYVGPCKACHGKGGSMRAVTVAQKAAADAAKAERKAKEITANLEKFAAEHPAEDAWIKARGMSFEFAGSMALALIQYGHLTEKQLAAVQKCVASDKARAEEKAQREAAAPVLSIGPLGDVFAKAYANGLKFPRLHFGAFAIYKASDTSKNPGHYYVVGDKDSDAYFGKITPAGKFMFSRDAGPELVAAVEAVMADPLASAVQSGIQTGICACCGAELTNPESIERGIGPICYSKWFA